MVSSCLFCRFLLDHGASVSAVNNDGELAIDISESDEMEELLQKEIDKQGVNCDKSRHTEERMMLEDARTWLNSKRFGDVAHAKTGATALHVAAAKGYNKASHTLMLHMAGLFFFGPFEPAWTRGKGTSFEKDNFNFLEPFCHIEI